MMIFRPAQMSDAEQITALAQLTGTGLTTLPKKLEQVKDKIQWSLDSFAADVQSAGNEYYLFVLENSETKEVAGTSALAAAVGLEQPFYTYKIGTQVHASPKLGVHNTVPTLILGHDYTGSTEICTLFLSPKHRGGNNGKLLSKGRFLFLADNRERFADIIIAEMRGYSDEKGRSPFWESLGRKFFDMDFHEADTRSGGDSNEFIAELMPKYPIYVSLLPDEAQKVIGAVHPDTRPAIEMLKKEGFEYCDYVDIFDAGPTIEARPKNIETIRNSSLKTVKVVKDVANKNKLLVANQKITEFRATLAQAEIEGDNILLTSEIVEALGIQHGDKVLTAPI